MSRQAPTIVSTLVLLVASLSVCCAESMTTDGTFEGQPIQITFVGLGPGEASGGEGDSLELPNMYEAKCSSLQGPTCALINPTHRASPSSAAMAKAVRKAIAFAEASGADSDDETPPAETTSHEQLQALADELVRQFHGEAGDTADLQSFFVDGNGNAHEIGAEDTDILKTLVETIAARNAAAQDATSQDSGILVADSEDEDDDHADLQPTLFA